MKLNYMFWALVAAWAGAGQFDRAWVARMHHAQIEMLKIDWGNPGFCTEWERDYNPKTRRCRDGRRPIRR